MTRQQRSNTKQFVYAAGFYESGSKQFTIESRDEYRQYRRYEFPPSADRARIDLFAPPRRAS